MKNFIYNNHHDDDYLKTFKQLSGYFQGNMLIGGSYTYSKLLNLKWNGKDIDIFFLMPRMETWALKNILNLVFDVVTVFDDAEKSREYYRIPGQWKRVIAFKNNMMYDLIFIDGKKENLHCNTGASISRLYYEVTFNKINLYYGCIKELKHILIVGLCYIDRQQCTKSYISKVEKLCEGLNLTLKNRSELGCISRDQVNKDTWLL